MSSFFSENSTANTSVPLCVDLDGTLILGNTLVETSILLLRQNPLFLFLYPWWLLSGRAAFKRQISERARLVFDRLSINPSVLDYLQEAKSKGRNLLLVTAADLIVAEQIANHFSLFSEVIASDGKNNLKGKNKADALLKRFGSKNFDYIGNDSNDFAVWQHANQALATNISSRLASRFTETFPNGVLLSVRTPLIASLSRRCGKRL